VPSQKMRVAPALNRMRLAESLSINVSLSPENE
jgi:hypothetical protein